MLRPIKPICKKALKRLAGTPVDLIMKKSGHKSLRDFYKYIRISPEEAGQKIREIWQNRGDMSIVKEAS